MGFFEKIKQGLAKTKNALGGTIDNVLSAFGVVMSGLNLLLEEDAEHAALRGELEWSAVRGLRTEKGEDD